MEKSPTQQIRHRNKLPSSDGLNTEGTLKTLIQTAQSVEKQIEHGVLVLIHDIPEWLQENEYIHTGHRQVSNSVSKSVRSIFSIHNETVNIWSHLIGAIIFCCLPFYVFYKEIPPRYRVATTSDIAVITIYFLAVAICFGLSATYHTLTNHSLPYHIASVQLDYLGILVLMTGALIPLIHYGFACDHHLRNTYWTIFGILASICAYATMDPRFRTSQAKIIRGIFYSCFGISSFVPILHAVSLYGWDVQKDRMALKWWMLVGVFDGIGVIAYASRFPERAFPRRFDILGASHQILHIGVFLAACMHVKGCLHSFDYSHRHGAICN